MTKMKKMMIISTIPVILLFIIILNGKTELISGYLIFLSFMFGCLFIWIGIQSSKPFDYSEYEDSYGTIAGINTDALSISLNIEFTDENGNKHRGLSQAIIGSNDKYSEGDKVKIKYKLKEKPFSGNDAIITVFDDELGEPKPNRINWLHIGFGSIWVFITIIFIFKYIAMLKS